MGYMRHHAIVVTGDEDQKSAGQSDPANLKRAHKKAREMFPTVSALLPGTINGYSTFLIPPDGSKEGWEDSETGDNRRSEFIDWLRAEKWSDGHGRLCWAEVQYGDDNGEAVVTTHCDDETSRGVAPRRGIK